jgi:hypothetical protein
MRLSAIGPLAVHGTSQERKLLSGKGQVLSTHHERNAVEGVSTCLTEWLLTTFKRSVNVLNTFNHLLAAASLSRPDQRFPSIQSMTRGQIS